MSDVVRLMAIGCLTVCLGMVLAITPANTNLAWGIFAALCSVVGVPVIAKGVKVARSRMKPNVKFRKEVRGDVNAVDIITAYQEAFGLSAWKVLIDSIAKLFGFGSVFQLADQYYKEADEALILHILEEDKTDLERYKAEDFDCDDFAFRLMGVFHQNLETAAMPILITWVSMPEGGHAVLSYYKDGQVRVIEPQNDEVYAVPQSWSLWLLCG